MCGLFGWQLSPQALEAGDVHSLATILAMFSERRGDESWGVFMVGGKHETPTLLKNVGSIKKTCRVRDIIAPQVVGHTRKATTGKVTQQNAHPFIWNNLVGAHNGFVYGHEQLNTKYKRDFEVDSQHLIAHIAEGKDLTELSGSGTVSYVKLDKPSAIYLGRGSGSDLVVYGIGPRSKPIGIVWASIANWVDDALMMAGFHDIWTFNTGIQKLYRVEGYELFEEGEFPFGYSQNRVRTIYQNDSMETTHTGNPYCGMANHGYRGRTLFDSREYGKEKGGARPKMTQVSKSELEVLPEHLKKNPEVGNVESEGKDQETDASTFQCDGCGDWGKLVASFEGNVDGITYYNNIDQYLCLHCAMYWSQQTCGRTVVPKLRLIPREREKGKEAKDEVKSTNDKTNDSSENPDNNH